jgi:hypothetical protein
MSSCRNLRQPSLCRRNHGVAFALADHPRMPRPNEVCRLGDPIMGGFAYVRRLGARKGIEKLTLVWDRAIVEQVAELREWVRFLKPIQKRGVIIYAFAQQPLCRVRSRDSEASQRNSGGNEVSAISESTELEFNPMPRGSLIIRT